MKLTLALAAFVLSQAASANVLSIGANSPDRVLADCQGTVNTQVNNGALNVVFRGVQNCSNFEILASNGSVTDYAKKLQAQGSGRSGSFTIPKRFIDAGGNQLVIQMESDSGKHADQIIVTFSANVPAPAPTYPSYPAPAQSGRIIQMSAGSVQALAACGGQASASIDSQGKVNLVFHGLTQCSNFSIVSANYSDLNYTRKVPVEGNGSARGGSFSIPKALIDSGLNVLYVQMSSNSGAHSDVLQVAFLAAPAPTTPSYPAPSYPAPSYPAPAPTSGSSSW